MDRNIPNVHRTSASSSRLPRGGRGSQHDFEAWRRLWRASPPARGAWIATRSCPRTAHRGRRLPRGGRGSQHVAAMRSRPATVASREGGVDRNSTASVLARLASVASREGGVDRNCHHYGCTPPTAMSPPARGAWIATQRNLPPAPIPAVASREGGVDRNRIVTSRSASIGRRLPRGGRGSQLEVVREPLTGAVASREGGVDRNG